MRAGFLLGLIFLASPILAQDDVAIQEPDTTFADSVRALFTERFPDHFFLYPVLKQRSLNFELEKSDRTGLLTFKPNNSYSFGVGMYLFELGVELAFAVPIDEKSKTMYGDSKARDLQLNVLGKQWGLDAFYQKYTGFYVTDRENPVVPDTPFPQRRDIDSRNFGLTGNYVFNNSKFSFRSVYNFSERQLSSKGSFLLFSNISSFRLSADSSILNSTQKASFGEQVSFTGLRYTTFSIAPGYTYSLIFKSFFLNGTVSLGPAHHWIFYRLEGGAHRNEIALNSFAAVRIGIGYNGERLFGGISFYTHGSTVKFEDVQFSNNNGSFKILVGYRFREVGFLKKRVWDLLPFKV